MSRNQLIVAETFYSIQGEGQTMGIPSVFLRLAGCNLLCESAHWRCDTIEVWQKGKTFPFLDVLKREYIEKLIQGAHLVITGGEPMMHADALNGYLVWLTENLVPKLCIEVETNGTVSPELILPGFVSYWNVSPKLANSGMPFERRVNELALKEFVRTKKAIFKFVISNEQDLIAMDEEYGFLPKDEIMLMPAGDTQELLSYTSPMVSDLCKRFGFRYSDRLHIRIWNQKTGV